MARSSTAQGAPEPTANPPELSSACGYSNGVAMTQGAAEVREKKKTQWTGLICSSAYISGAVLRNNVLNGPMLVRCLAFADAVPVASFAGQMIPRYGTRTHKRQ